MASNTTRKPPLNSVAGQAGSFANVQKLFKPTKKLNADAMEAFDAIIASREADSWTPHDLRLATELAQMSARMSSVMDDMVEQEPVLLNPRGTSVANPLYSVAMQLSNAVQALNRALGLTASAKGLNTSAQGKRNKADATAREVIQRAQTADGLL